MFAAAWLMLGGLLYALQLQTGSFPKPLTPEEEVMEAVNEEIVRQVLAGLKGYDGEIYLRRYFWCQSVREIARQMGLKPKIRPYPPRIRGLLSNFTVRPTICA